MSNDTPILETQLADPVWQRAEGEGDKPSEAFIIYRDLNESRSLAKVADELGKSKSLIERWSRRWRWRIRVDAYDGEQDVTRLLASNQAIIDMSTRHARQAQTAVQTLLLPHFALARKMRDNPEIVELLSKADLHKLLQLAASTTGAIAAMMQAERLARGEPTEIRYSRSEEMSVELTAELSVDDYKQIAKVLDDSGFFGSLDSDTVDASSTPD